MNLSQFKSGMAKKYHASNNAIRVILKLDGLNFEGEKIIKAEGSAYQCKLVAQSGKYLPRKISITGTKSAYAFKYDYTTGVIYIPSNEIYKSITITAIADTVNNNVPAVLQVQKQTLDPKVDGTSYSDQSFVAVMVTPSRGSTVSVNFGGVTKTITGDLPTTQYDSPAQLVVFGLYGTVDDGTTANSGNLTISGAYESYSSGIFNTSKSTGSYADFITGISQTGSIRYLSDVLAYNNYMSVTFTRELEAIKKPVLRVVNDQNSGMTLVFEKPVQSISTQLVTGTGGMGDSATGTVNTYYNNVDWDWWTQGDRTNYAYCIISSDTVNFYAQPYINNVKYDSVSNVPLTNNCNKIGNYAFYYFTNLKSINIPNSVKSIGNYAFADSGLTSVIIPDSVVSIGSYAFYRCYNLGSLHIPSSITSIDSGMASWTTQLTTLTVDSANSVYYGSQNCIIEKDTGILVVGCGGSVIPSGVKEIGSLAFNHTTLTSVVIPEGVTNIQENAFYDNTNLTHITLPSSLKTIDDYGFYKNTSGNYGKYSITILATTPPEVNITNENNYFHLFGYSHAVNSITVPKGCGDVYKTANVWSYYADLIVEAS